VTAAACADLVRRGDPDRWRAAMTAPPDRRDGLMALYAFNLEIARAAYATSDPMLGAIRLRWWSDALAEVFAGQPARRHEVVLPLAETIRASALPREPLEAMVDARGWDCGREGFADLVALEAYLDATAGGLVWLSARHLGAPDRAEPVARDAGFAAGTAAFLRAVPQLAALGRDPLPGGRLVPGDAPPPPAVAATIRALAAAAQARLARARAGRGLLPAACLPAFLSVVGAGGVLARAGADPGRVTGGALEPSEFARRAGLLAAALSGRW
jgi:phytoene/squalene synthetase